MEDGSGNVIASDSTDQMALAITATSAHGATLKCLTNPVTVAEGVASFRCSIKKIGKHYALTASSGSLADATSSSFKVIERA